MQTLSLTENEVQDLLEIPEGEHLVARFSGPADGPTVIIFGSIHGNEQSGVRAMRAIASKIEQFKGGVLGNIYFVAGNTRAFNKNTRYIDSDLNRHWTIENVARNDPASKIATNRVEDIEQKEILALVEEALSKANNEVFALDLHSTSSKSTPFAMIGDTLRNRTFAQKFPATFLLGIEEQLDGTVMEFMNELGAVTLGFEAGQHTTRAAVQNQEALIWTALGNSGVLRSDLVPQVQLENLSRAMGRKRIIEIRYRHAITLESGFEMEPGFKTFQPVKKGQLLAHDQNGEVKAAEKGMILMPLYQKQGSDGFFIGREISPFWLWLSRLLRSAHIGNLMRFLPGVNRHPTDRDSLIINTGVARILPLQIFHLLGFRKRRWRDDTLVVSRRRHDTLSPFVQN